MTTFQPPAVRAANVQVAEQLQWDYRVPGASESQSTFYYDLQPYVAAELRNKLQEAQLGKVGQRLYLDVQGYRVEMELVMVRPPAARLVAPSTSLQVMFRPPTPEEQQRGSFISAVVDYPNEEYGAWFNSLVGIDAIKRDLLDKMLLLLNKGAVIEWSLEKYGAVLPACAALLNRYPFFILEGEVGSGKTALTRSIGHPLSVALGRDVQLLVVNTQVRGTGLVGELTHNISMAFNEAEERNRRLGVPVLLLIDEADALAQTRGQGQMHHEDEAGVNTLIQRIDLLREPGKEVIVLFATNMGSVLDSAIRRRSAATYHFDRPSSEIRKLLFEGFLVGSGVTSAEIEALVEATQPRKLHGFGEILHPFTHSDIVQRIIPGAVEQLYLGRDGGLGLFQMLIKTAAEVMPTPRLPSTPGEQEG